MELDEPHEARAVGANIARARKRAGLNQTQLAERMREAGHVTWRQNTVSRIERGEQELRAQELGDLEKLLEGGLLDGTRASDAMRPLRRKANAARAARLRRADGALELARVKLEELRQIEDELDRARKEIDWLLRSLGEASDGER